MEKLYDQHGQVAVIALHNPPVNGLCHELRTRILAAQKAAEADPSIKALVLIGSGRVFSGGADIREFNTPKGMAEPTLPTVLDALDFLQKPVIAAIGGVCMGGGLELAMACHYRVALHDALIALPEVKLGILPGAGGTQRLPRLLPVETALNMIVFGEPLPARQLQSTLLFDAILEGELFEGALAFAQKIIQDNPPLRRTRDLPLVSTQDAMAQASALIRKSLAPHYPAPIRCIEAVSGAFSLAFDSGIQLEKQLFQELVESDVSKALRHAFFGERAASKLADIPDTTKTRDIRRVAVIGAGTMGRGIAMNFLNAGLPVVLIEQHQDALVRGIAAIRSQYESSVKKGKLKEADFEKRLALLTSSLAYEDLKDADLIIEAVFENMDVKLNVFKSLDQVVKPGAILASNTSTLDVNAIASATSRPQDVLGLHFFSPAHIMKLLEVVRGAQTAPDVLATAMALAKTIKKTAVVSGVCDGFIGNRMIESYSQQAMKLLEEGATPQQIDRALEQFGMAMGPFRMSDLAGNDIGWAIRKGKLAISADPHYPRLADRLCEKGRFGQKTGLGWYRYEAGRREALVDPAVNELIVAYREEKGMKARTISDAEIVDRCILALVNEGARILEDRIAQRSSDIDMVYLSGYGFPLFRGGPMFYADSIGLKTVLEKIQNFQKESDDPFWKPANLLASLAAQGRTFNSTVG